MALAGKPIATQKHAEVLQLYASLNSVISIARVTGRAADFELQSVVDAILQKKLPHLQDKWARKCAKQLRERKQMFGFADFLNYLNDEHFVVEKLHRSSGNKTLGSVVAQKPGGGSARVAATGAVEVKSGSTSGAASVARTGASAPSCLHCKGAHLTGSCTKFRSAEPRVKRALVRSNNLCWKCLGSGHLARDCKANPKCDECGGPHHTSLHDVQSRGMPVVEEVTPAAPHREA